MKLKANMLARWYHGELGIFVGIDAKEVLALTTSSSALSSSRSGAAG